MVDPVKDQPCSYISPDDNDFTNCSVDCYAVDASGGDWDQIKDYTVGTLHERGYLFDHRVKKGFSGGAVVEKGRERVIGVISQRDKDDQETLFVPLYRTRQWLLDLRHKQNDPEISEFVDTCTCSPAPIPAPIIHTRQLHTDIEKLAIFVDRPKQAYLHVLTELAQGKRALKLCLCVSTLGNDDWPEEFAQAIGLRLSATRNPGSAGRLLDFTDKFDFSARWVKHSVWDAKNYQAFKQRCLAEIVDVLQGPSYQAEQSTDNSSDELAQNIAELLKVQPRPKVLLLRSDQTEANGMLASLFAAKRARKNIDKRFEWMDRFNREWIQRPLDVSAQPLVFLFCVQVSRKTAEHVKQCFRLATVMQEDFESWRVDVQNLLIESRHYQDGRLFAGSSAFAQRFSERLEDQQLTFPIPYKTFKQQIEKVSQTYEQHS